MNIKTLQRHPLFVKFSEQDLQHLMDTARLLFHTYKNDHILHHQNDKANHLEIILHGSIILQRTDITGKLLTIATLKKNDIIGGHLLFCDDGQYSGDVIAKQETDCVSIDRNTLLELCQKNIFFLESFLKLLSDNTQLLNRKIQETTQQTIRNQLILIFKKQYQKTNSLIITLPTNKKQLAQSFGVARTSISRQLKQMSDEHLIVVNRSQITILSKEWIERWKSEDSTQR